MNCENIEVYINKYLDGEINEKDKTIMFEHIDNCEKCKELFDEFVLINEIIGETELAELPENYSNELMKKLEKETYSTNNNLKNKKTKVQDTTRLGKILKVNFGKSVKKQILAAAAIFLVGVVIYGATNNMNMKSIYYESASDLKGIEQESIASVGEANFEAEQPNLMAFDENNMDDMDSSKVNTLTMNKVGVAENNSVEKVESKTLRNANLNRKIIKNANISVEVENFKTAIDYLYNFVNSNGGYVSNFNSYIYDDNYEVYSEDMSKDLYSGNMTIRIPSEKFDILFNEIDGIGKIKSKNIYTSDITSRYRDYYNEVKNLEVREKKLREIMENAKDIKDVLEVERELSRVRGEINGYKSTLKKWDELVELSTVEVNIIEVQNLTNSVKSIDKGIIQKSKEGFIKNLNKTIMILENLIIFLISNVINILILCVIIYIAFKKYKGKFKKE